MADIYFRPDGANRFQIRSAAGLTLPSAWLDQEFNRIYSYLNTIEGGGATTGSEWATVQAEATQTSTTSFTVEGDYSSVFEALRAIQFKDGNDTYTISHIKSVVYVGGTNLTTVTVYDAVVPSTIAEVNVGLIGSEAQPIPSLSYITRTSGYTIKARDQIVFVDDSSIGNLTKTWDDGATGGDETAYYALWITLPVASDMPGKLLCIKKISGTYRTIVAAHATRTDTTVDDVTTHTYTYDFQIYGDTDAKNRITLKGIGDSYWLFSNGSRWYELTPEASETVKGIVRMATDDEMTLTAQQIADGETLRKDLAVSPYQVDKGYLRTDASNMRFASSYIYKTPNITGLPYGTAAYLSSGQIVVPQGVGVVIPYGRDANGVCQTIKIETAQNYETTLIESSGIKKTLFLTYNPITQDISLTPFFTKNVYYGYYFNKTQNPYYSNDVLWLNYHENHWLYSSDGGTNWTLFYGVPVCEFWGNGTVVTGVTSFSPVSFATREEIDLLKVDYIIDQYYDGDSTGFRVWKSGIIENWGYCPGGGSTYYSFLRPYSNEYYNIVGGTSNVAQQGGTHWCVNRTAAGFTLIAGYGDVGYNRDRGGMWFHTWGA